MSNKNSISYRNVGDYLIPNLTLPYEEATFRQSLIFASPTKSNTGTGGMMG